jgi:phosphinothricin acetyltransferase
MYQTISLAPAPFFEVAAPVGELRIAAAADCDLTAITSIYREHCAHGFGAHESPIPDETEMARRLTNAQEAGLPVLVAIDGDGTVQGFTYARPWRERAGYRHTVEDSIYVAHRARRQGVGKLLLDRLIDACEALGVRRMIAVIGDARNKASIELHQSLGFELCGYFPGASTRPDETGAFEELDVAMLQRALGARQMVGHA